MPFLLSCRDVTHLVLEREDRALSLPERIGVRYHMLICSACPPFARQAALMRRAMRHWRQQAEGDPADADTG